MNTISTHVYTNLENKQKKAGSMKTDSKNNQQDKHKKGKKNLFVRFKNFVARGNVLNFGIGIIIGNSFTDVINGFVDNIVMPLLGIVLGKIDLTQLQWQFTPDVNITYGKFIQAAINFLLIALSIFIFCILIGDDPDQIKTKDEAQKAQVEKTNQLLEEIRDALKNSKQSQSGEQTNRQTTQAYGQTNQQTNGQAKDI